MYALLRHPHLLRDKVDGLPDAGSDDTTEDTDGVDSPDDKSTDKGEPIAQGKARAGDRANTAMTRKSKQAERRAVNNTTPAKRRPGVPLMLILTLATVLILINVPMLIEAYRGSMHQSRKEDDPPK